MSQDGTTAVKQSYPNVEQKATEIFEKPSRTHPKFAGTRRMVQALYFAINQALLVVSEVWPRKGRGEIRIKE